MIRGMDISGYQELKEQGFRYYDEMGNEVDSLEYAVRRGFNYARLRLWNEPQNMPESGGYCDLARTIEMAKLIKAQGIGFFLDFHYSDWWADPGQQRKPKAWEGLSVEELVQAVYDYTKECLLCMEREGVYPDMIQIGNEIRTGMLFPDGAVPNWDNLAKFVNAGIRAVRDTQGGHDTRIVLHLDQGGKYEYFREWFDQMTARGVEDFDIIGLSFYPFWHGTYAMFKQNMDALVERYGKDIIVAETAHAFRKSGGAFFREPQEQAAGFDATPENQRLVLSLITSIIGNVRDGRGLGYFYWEPFTRAPEDSTGWGVCMGLMDENGRPTEGYNAVTYEPQPDAGTRIAKVYCPKQLEFVVDDCHMDEQSLLELLPKTLPVLYWDGTERAHSVAWTTDDGGHLSDREPEEKQMDAKRYCVSLAGILSDVPEEWRKVSSQVTVKEAGENLLANGDFHDGLNGFTVRTQEDIVHLDTDGSGLCYRADQNFKLHVETVIPVQKAGAYQATIRYKGGNTTGTELDFFVTAEGYSKHEPLFPKEQEFSVGNIYFELNFPGEVVLGIDMAAPTVSGTIREIRLEHLG